MEPADVAFTDGPDAAALCEHYWFNPDPWQRDILDCWLGRDENGVLLVISAGISCPRQNGKNGAIEALEFYLLLTDPNTHILHTAHSTKTAQKAFERMVKVFSGKVPGKGRQGKAITRYVDKKRGGKIRYTNGEWAIYLSNGASIEYCTRTNAGGRGFDNITLLVFDEAQQLNDEQLQAVMSTLAASKGDQMIIYAGTPPNETASGAVFGRRRQAILDGIESGELPERASWHEWSVDARPREGSTFEEILPLVYETNPSMELDRPGHLRESFTRQEFIDMDFDGFCRERLGFWQDSIVVNPIVDFDAWKRLYNPSPTKAKKNIKRAIGVKFSHDGNYVAVSIAIKRTRMRYTTAVPHVELVLFEDITSRGVGPLAKMLYGMRNQIAFVLIDGASNSDVLVKKLEELKYPKAGYRVTAPKDAVGAAQMMIDAIRDEAVTHFGQEALDESVRTAVRRDIGAYGGFGFGGVSPEPLDSAALALYALNNTKRNPSRKMRVL